jgi:chaperonin GroES
MKKESTQHTKKPVVQPLGDRILIKEETAEGAERTTKSGIIIPLSVKEDKGAKRGEVVAVGAGKYEDGKMIPVTVKVGETVLFSWGDKLTIDGEEYYIVRESEVMAVVK